MSGHTLIIGDCNINNICSETGTGGGGNDGGNEGGGGDDSGGSGNQPGGIDDDCFNELTAVEKLTMDVSNNFGGAITQASGDGIKITWNQALIGSRDLVLRIMNSSGARELFWRLSIDGKGNFTLDWILPSNRALKHHQITTQSFNDIITLLTELLP